MKGKNRVQSGWTNKKNFKLVLKYNIFINIRPQLNFYILILLNHVQIIFRILTVSNLYRTFSLIQLL